MLDPLAFTSTVSFNSLQYFLFSLYEKTGEVRIPFPKDLKFCIGPVTRLDFWNGKAQFTVSQVDLEALFGNPEDQPFREEMVGATTTDKRILQNSFKYEFIFGLYNKLRNFSYEFDAYKEALAGRDLGQMFGSQIECDVASNLHIRSLVLVPKNSIAKSKFVFRLLEIKPLWKWMVTGTDNVDKETIEIFLEAAKAKGKGFGPVEKNGINFVIHVSKSGFIHSNTLPSNGFPMWAIPKNGHFSDNVRQFVNRQLAF